MYYFSNTIADFKKVVRSNDTFPIYSKTPLMLQSLSPSMFPILVIKMLLCHCSLTTVPIFLSHFDYGIFSCFCFYLFTLSHFTFFSFKIQKIFLVKLSCFFNTFLFCLWTLNFQKQPWRGVLDNRRRLWEYLLQKQPPEVFHKKVVPRNFAKLTGKHLC